MPVTFVICQWFETTLSTAASAPIVSETGLEFASRQRTSANICEHLRLATSPFLDSSASALVFVYLSTCRSTCLPVCLSACLSVFKSVGLFVFPTVSLFVCLSDGPSVCLSVYLSVSLRVYPSVSLSACLSFYLSICLSVCLSGCLFMCIPTNLCRSDCLSVVPLRRSVCAFIRVRRLIYRSSIRVSVCHS